MHEDASLAVRAIQLAARGYVTKSDAPEVLATAVTAVAAGRLFMSDDVATSIAILEFTGDGNPVTALGAREFEIFRLLATGRPASEIARILNLSVKTVANYHTLIKQKLQITSDVELVLLALRHKLL
jgi:two-component system invasion response regulator UvrY